MCLFLGGKFDTFLLWSIMDIAEESELAVLYMGCGNLCGIALALRIQMRIQGQAGRLKIENRSHTAYGYLRWAVTSMFLERSISI